MPRSQQAEESLIAMTEISATEQNTDDILRQVLEVACSALPGADAGGITLVEAEGPRTAMATSAAALTADSAQYGATSGGPCLEAYRR